jgi:hypothetical protein
MKAKLEQTTDYSMFEMHPCNRTLRDKPELEQSMQKHGFLPSGAIHVCRSESGKLRVIRGHHRLHYAMRIKLPVYYIVDDAQVDIFELEGDTTATWSMQDFAAARAASGDKPCQQLLAFQKKHGVPIGIAASLIAGETAGSANANKQVKAGRLKLGDQKHANEVGNILEQLKGFGVEVATAGLFVVAISKVLRVPEFDSEAFLSKMRLYPMNIHRRTTVKEYLEEIEALYNYAAKSAKTRIPLAFRAKEISMKRHLSFGKQS